MTMTDSERAIAAGRIIATALGEPYGDGDIVTDIGIGYANGRFDSYARSQVWVTGNWNDKTTYDPETSERTTVSNLPSRLGNALDRLGVNIEWLDEWRRCDDCQQLIRTEPDSYGWTPEYVDCLDGGCGIVCAECARNDAESILSEYYTNNVRMAVTWILESELSELGWSDAMPAEPSAATGWHPGQDDTPAGVLARWQGTATDNGAGFDWLFVITDKGQFDIHYRLFVRPVDSESDR